MNTNPPKIANGTVKKIINGRHAGGKGRPVRPSGLVLGKPENLQMAQ